MNALQAVLVTSRDDSSRDLAAASADDAVAAALAEEQLVKFFHHLDRASRRQLEKLAEADKRFGEDVETERRETDGDVS